MQHIVYRRAFGIYLNGNVEVFHHGANRQFAGGSICHLNDIVDRDSYAVVLRNRHHGDIKRHTVHYLSNSTTDSGTFDRRRHGHTVVLYFVAYGLDAVAHTLGSGIYKIPVLFVVRSNDTYKVALAYRRIFNLTGECAGKIAVIIGSVRYHGRYEFLYSTFAVGKNNAIEHSCPISRNGKSVDTKRESLAGHYVDNVGNKTGTAVCACDFPCRSRSRYSLRLFEVGMEECFSIYHRGINAGSIGIQTCAVGIHLHSCVAERIVGFDGEFVCGAGSDFALGILSGNLDTGDFLNIDSIGACRNRILPYYLLEVRPVFFRTVSGLASNGNDELGSRATVEHAPVDPCRRLAAHRHFAQLAAAKEHIILPSAYRCGNFHSAKACACEAAILKSGKA